MPIFRLLRLLGAASFLVAAARLIGSSRRRPHDPTQEHVKAGNADEGGDQPREQERSKWAAPHRDADNRTSPGDERQQRCERRYWIVTGITSVAATLATVVAAGFAIGAYNASWESVKEARNQVIEANRQANEAVRQSGILRDTLIASNRAWLDMDIEIASDLNPQVDGENLTVQATVHNFGHSPALGVFLTMEFYPNPLFGQIGQPLEAACHRRNKEAIKGLTAAGKLIVPGAPS